MRRKIAAAGRFDQYQSTAERLINHALQACLEFALAGYDLQAALQRAQGSAAVDIYTYLKFLDSVIQKLKSLRKILKAQLHSPLESDSR